MTYKKIKEKAKKQFLEKFPNYEILLIWDNRQIVFGKMTFMVKARSFTNEIIEERVVVDV